MNRIFNLILLLALYAVQAQAQTKIWADNFSLRTDGTTPGYLNISMTDANRSYSGFQGIISVPKGIHIKTISGENVDARYDVSLDDTRFEGLDHAVTINMPDDTSVRFTCVDIIRNATFFNTDAEGSQVKNLLAIGFVADEDMEAGEYTIRFRNLEMILPDAESVTPDAEVTCRLLVIDENTMTGIESANGDDAQQKYYNTAGQQLPEMQKGINISAGKKQAKN